MPQNEQKVAFIGFGDLGKQLLALYTDYGKINELVVFDDHEKASSFECFPFESYADKRFENYSFHVCLGYHHLHTKKNILDNLRNLDRRILSIIHPSSYISNSASIEDGVAIYPMCNIDSNAQIKAGSLLNNSVVVSHNCLIDQCSYLSPGVVLSGRVLVGKYSFLGSGTSVSHNTNIGDDCKIGIGSCVTADIPKGSTAIGNPLRFLQKDLKIK